MAVKPAQVRKARSYLYSRHPSGFGIPPHKFAAAAQETGSSFDNLMKFISVLYSRGQQQSVFREQEIANASQGATTS